jgi:hypothetical protein
MMHGVYKVVGTLEYRGHKPGEIFAARLDRPAESRAINRGNIILLEHIQPSLPPEYGFPDGWLSADTVQSNDAPDGASVVERGK